MSLDLDPAGMGWNWAIFPSLPSFLLPTYDEIQIILGAMMSWAGLDCSRATYSVH